MTSQSQRSTMTYKHLTREERYQIHSLKRQGVALGCIAAELGRNRSTVSREIQRNSAATGYKPALAHDKALARQHARRNAQHFSPEQWGHVEALLRLSLSPQQVSGRLRLEKAICISTEAIYQRAYRDKAQGGDLVSYLRCQKARRKRYASGQERRGTVSARPTHLETKLSSRDSVHDEDHAHHGERSSRQSPRATFLAQNSRLRSCRSAVKAAAL